MCKNENTPLTSGEIVYIVVALVFMKGFLLSREIRAASVISGFPWNEAALQAPTEKLQLMLTGGACKDTIHARRVYFEMDVRHKQSLLKPLVYTEE